MDYIAKVEQNKKKTDRMPNGVDDSTVEINMSPEGFRGIYAFFADFKAAFDCGDRYALAKFINVIEDI